jgi:hypothetical protein
MQKFVQKSKYFHFYITIITFTTNREQHITNSNSMAEIPGMAPIFIRQYPMSLTKRFLSYGTQGFLIVYLLI